MPPVTQVAEKSRVYLAGTHGDAGAGRGCHGPGGSIDDEHDSHEIITSLNSGSAIAGCRNSSTKSLQDIGR